MSHFSLDVNCGMDLAGLPTPPAVLIELIDSFNSSDVSFSHISEVIRKDTSISSKVITAANSPAYRQWNEITDINRLIVVLGLQTVKTIAITGAVQQFFSQVAQPVERCLNEIWHDSLNCAYIARSLAELTTYPSPEEAYLAGLLHRLGQLALLHNFPEEYSELFDQRLSGEKLSAAEKEKLQVSSCEVGAHLIDSWQIRSFISDAVLYQHAPTEAILDSSHLVKLVNLASHLSAADSGLNGQVLERADLLFGLNQNLVESLLKRAQENVKSAADALGIKLARPQDSDRRDSVREALGERVKGLALLGSAGTERSSSPDLQQTYKLVARDIGILFGLHSSCFLMHAPASDRLETIAQDTSKAKLFSDIRFSLNSDRSLAARAFHDKEPKISFELHDPAYLAVADHQLIRLLGGEGLLYLPLSSTNRGLGLLAVGLDQADWQQLKQQSELLQLFANEVSNTLIHQVAKQDQEKERLSEERNNFQLEARKIVHEANNPLGIITNYLHILGIKLGQAHPVQEELTIIKEEIERVGKIILRMRDIPYEMEHPGLSVDINDLIEDLVKLFNSSLFATHDIEAILELDKKMPPLVIERGHLKQILTNLVKNAVEAMQSGGHLTISTRDKIHFNSATYFELQVRDDGPGIPEEIMQQLFKPVITTKDNTHSGLGLAIVKNLVDELSGSISCSSSPESGTRFQLLLPRKTQAIAKAENQ